ncbi:tetratricopeptide repeat protein [Pedobacter changchengzhani]|uniref:Tetratricopeptide repeat protein n=1 Tax=Pedobacter changchengzhani TaxID=2529274 RepID=A0A4V3A059_9SPHI|nr:tetratricopeptide repeat-containing sensor histidine kinase [Pedobacter changchengzhani]TDG35953.1 tetratricopeptide repeat protein [Pedobacter changchengzhani]
MNKWNYLFVTILTFYSSNLLAQQISKSDELISKLNKNIIADTTRVKLLGQISTSYIGTNPTKMLSYAKEAIALATKLKYKKGIAENLRFQGIAYYSVGNFKSAESSFSSALKIHEELKNVKGIIACLSNLGTVNTVQNNYPTALMYYQKSVRLGESIKDEMTLGITFGNMGVIYSELKNYDLALQYFQKGLALHTKINYVAGIASGLDNLGNIYFYKKDYKTSISKYQEALEENIQMGNKMGMAREYGNIANVYTELGNYKEALANANKALNLNEEIKNRKGIAAISQTIGNALNLSGKYNEALLYSTKANNLSKEINIRDVQKESSESLSQIYEKIGQPDSALKYYRSFVALKDLVDNDVTKKQISRLEVQYEFDKKEESYKSAQLLSTEKLGQQQLMLTLNQYKLAQSNKEKDLGILRLQKSQAQLKNEQLEKIAKQKQLILSEKENEITKLSLQATQREKWYYIVGLTLLLIIGFLLYLQGRTTKKLNSQLLVFNDELDRANKVKTRFFSILNHDLRSPVSNLVHFLHLQKEAPEMLSESDKIRLENKTLNATENLLQSMEDLLIWSKGQMEHFEPKIQLIGVSNLFDDTNRHFSSQEHTSIQFNNPENLTLNTDEDYLKTIIRNLTGNAIKALSKTPNAEIIWSAYSKDGQKFLSITDNGPGATDENFKALYDDREVVGIKTGLGLHLIRDLAIAINCKITLNSQVGRTTFILAF